MRRCGGRQVEGGTSRLYRGDRRARPEQCDWSCGSVLMSDPSCTGGAKVITESSSKRVSLVPFSVTSAWTAAGVATVAVNGEVDLDTSSALETEFARVLGTRPGTVVADLTNITFCSSSGLVTLVKLHTACIAANLDLAIAPSRIVWKAVDVTGLGVVLPVDEA
jgi:anti-sigma B factor antagonist